MSFSNITTALASLAFVLALLAIARQLAIRFKGMPILAAPPGTARTLAVEQSLSIDPKRRLVLIRCDGRQLLLLTGGPQDLLVGWMEPSA